MWLDPVIAPDGRFVTVHALHPLSLVRVGRVDLVEHADRVVVTVWGVPVPQPDGIWPATPVLARTPVSFSLEKPLHSRALIDGSEHRPNQP